MKTLAEMIEDYLLTDGGWVPASLLCLVFGVDQRKLRATGRAHGIGELVRMRRMRRRRAGLLVPRAVPPAETLGGQFLLLGREAQ